MPVSAPTLTVPAPIGVSGVVANGGSTAEPSEVDLLVERAVQALHDYAGLTQDDIDHIVAKAAVAALDQHGQFAQAAVAERGAACSRTRR